MKTGSTAEVNHLLGVIPDAAALASIEQLEAITRAILDDLSPVVGEGR